MKTLIIYASTYGYTEEMVNKMIAESGHKFESVNIVKNNNIDLEKYDGVILGSSVYMGQINRKLKRFTQVNSDVLMTNKLGIFLACGSDEIFDTEIKGNFSEVIIKHASIIVNLGGKIQKDKLNFIHKFVMSMVEKSEEGRKQMISYPDRTLEIVSQFYRA